MPPTATTGLAITNPLVKYRALVATKAIAPDNGQLRLALHLQKLYDRLKDYEPQVEYSHRLDQITRAVRNDANASNGVPDPEYPPPRSSWRTFLAAKEKRDSLALTRKLTSHEEAMQLSSPRGLMLHGEVGTGKSMLVDLFAECLPTRKKRRWHFNTFMLETFAKLESLRRSRSVPSFPSSAAAAAGRGVAEQDYPLLLLARDLIQTSPILFLDEFQMPDRAASKILTNLMTSFFHLGGVLIATSNRMPEELAKASGVEFSPSPSRLEALGWQFGFRSRSARGGVGGGMYGQGSEFARFLDVLKARCEVWEMEGGRDYRRIESGSATPVAMEGEGESEWEMDGHDDLQGLKSAAEQELEVAAGEKSDGQTAISMPMHYQLVDVAELDKRKAYTTALEQATGDSFDIVKFIPGTMKVYGRTIIIPRTYKGTTDWTFTELCKTTLGPADYITLASTYHTLFLHDVPILTSLLKNEARRFITLLDALYECRCKLFLTAAAGPDDLFFPEDQHDQHSNNSDQSGDSIQSETFSEAYQDATAPFRPHILTQNPNYAEPDPEPDFTHARLAGLLNADAIEDDPPNKPASAKQGNPFGRSFGRSDAELGRRPIDPDETPSYAKGGMDFGKTSAFTGEDEKFAYKRAQSRLWEMCGQRWWGRREEGWHRPLPAEVRRWERSVDEVDASEKDRPGAGVRGGGDVRMGESSVDETREEGMFRHGGSPFRTEREPPPKLSAVHAWGMMRWGPKAGAWGKGVEGLKERGSEKR